MNRRAFLRTAATMSAAPLVMRVPEFAGMRKPMQVYVGTYTDGESEGIYRCTFDSEGGALDLVDATSGIENPSFLAIDPSGRYLFAVSETGDGEIVSYRIGSDSQKLEELSRRPAHGGAPCHITVDATGRYVLAANYTGGNVVMLPAGRDGMLGEATAVIQHEGSSVNPDRQTAPHAHSVTIDPSNRYVFAADLGLDQILVYALDLENGALQPSGSARVAPGSGPRHFDFHPDGRRAYVINELGSTITAFTYDPEAASLEESQTISTLPSGFDGENSCADIHVHPSGRFVYGSNRGHDSVAVFAIDGEGRLSAIQHQRTGGSWPRNFSLDPSGRFLLAANQRTNDIVVFSIDPGTGMLEETGHQIDIPSPVCIRFLEA